MGSHAFKSCSAADWVPLRLMGRRQLSVATFAGRQQELAALEMLALTMVQNSQTISVPEMKGPEKILH